MVLFHFVCPLLLSICFTYMKHLHKFIYIPNENNGQITSIRFVLFSSYICLGKVSMNWLMMILDGFGGGRLLYFFFIFMIVVVIVIDPWWWWRWRWWWWFKLIFIYLLGIIFISFIICYTFLSCFFSSYFFSLLHFRHGSKLAKTKRKRKYDCPMATFCVFVISIEKKKMKKWIVPDDDEYKLIFCDCKVKKNISVFFVASSLFLFFTWFVCLDFEFDLCVCV